MLCIYWVEGLIDVNNPIIEKTIDDRFWCSALIAYVYTKLGYLNEDTKWTLINPEDWNYKKNKLNFMKTKSKS